jgi:predicted PurR-regulated permease PerM
MRVMAVSFFAGLLFAPWRREGLWVFLMALATLLLLILCKLVDPSLTRSLAGSVIHLVLWPIILWLLWYPGARERRRSQPSSGVWPTLFQGWLAWVTLLIAISLVLDARYLLQYLSGQG